MLEPLVGCRMGFATTSYILLLLVSGDRKYFVEIYIFLSNPLPISWSEWGLLPLKLGILTKQMNALIKDWNVLFVCSISFGAVLFPPAWLPFWIWQHANLASFPFNANLACALWRHHGRWQQNTPHPQASKSHYPWKLISESSLIMIVI